MVTDRAAPLYLDEATLMACLSEHEIHEVVCATLASLGHGRAALRILRVS